MKNRPAVTVEQIQALDRLAIDEIGIPSLVLMENAGRAVAAEALKMLRRTARPRVVVVCGLGNNAGDGLVAARHLWNAGLAVRVFMAGGTDRLSPDAAVHYQILQKSGYRLESISAPDRAFQRAVRQADLVIDAIFGVGLNRPVGSPFKGVIDFLNDARRRVLAVDVPSGLDGTTGAVCGTAVRSAVTVTFSLAKTGLSRGQGPALAGRVEVADIGIPQRLLSGRRRGAGPA